MTYDRLVPRYDDPDPREVEREMLAHAAHEVAARMYELYPPQDAHWILTVATIAADRNYRSKRNG